MHLRILLVAPLTAALLACGTESDSRCGPSTPAYALLSGIGATAHPHQRWLDLNETIPSFAGHYLKDDRPHMLLLEDAPQEDIEMAHEWAGADAVVLTTASFTFRELHDHWNAGRDVLFSSLPGGHLSGYGLRVIDNVVGANVETQEDLELANEVWADAGLPPLAFVAEIGPPTCFLSD